MCLMLMIAAGLLLICFTVFFIDSDSLQHIGDGGWFVVVGGGVETTFLPHLERKFLVLSGPTPSRPCHCEISLPKPSRSSHRSSGLIL